MLIIKKKLKVEQYIIRIFNLTNINDADHVFVRKICIPYHDEKIFSDFEYKNCLLCLERDVNILNNYDKIFAYNSKIQLD